MKKQLKRGSMAGRREHRLWLTCFLFLLCILLPATGSAAEESVTARYLRLGGSALTVEINVGSPPPSSLILVQHLPPGTRLLDSSPAVNNVNVEKGEAKWLLHSIPSGRLVVEMTLDRPVGADEAAAEIRFKPLEGGGMVIVPVAKP
ncbi:MAG TPA: hypothetical protein ENN06_10980 [Desulfobacteraceae bacterium]|nr:hypothetical protein [Desulfobacteraceae bacterium]